MVYYVAKIGTLFVQNERSTFVNDKLIPPIILDTKESYFTKEQAEILQDLFNCRIFKYRYYGKHLDIEYDVSLISEKDRWCNR